MQNDGVLAVRLLRGGALGLVMLCACGPDPGPPIPYLAEQVATIEITGEGFAADGELDEAFYASSVGACEVTHAVRVSGADLWIAGSFVEATGEAFLATSTNLTRGGVAQIVLPDGRWGRVADGTIHLVDEGDALTLEVSGESWCALDDAGEPGPCVEERVDARFVATVSSLRYRTCAKEALPADGYGDACVRTSGSVECVEDAVPE